MKNLQETLNGWFNFNEWSSYQNQPKEFSSQLSEFLSFKIYSNFKEFLTNNDHYLVDFDGNDININEVLSSKENFSEFVENQFNFSSLYDISYEQINEEILYAQAYDTTEPRDFIELVSNIKSENDLLVFLNEVLTDCGEVTHSTGIKNKYEVTGIDK